MRRFCLASHLTQLLWHQAMDIGNLLNQQRPSFNPDHMQPPKQQSSRQDSPIPCILDLKTGSLVEEDKRKANRDASRRSRNRKRENKQHDLLVSSQIKCLKSRCAFYESERDYFRDELHRYIHSSQLPPRPPTPQPIPCISPQSSSSPTQLEKTDPHGRYIFEDITERRYLYLFKFDMCLLSRKIMYSEFSQLSLGSSYMNSKLKRSY